MKLNPALKTGLAAFALCGSILTIVTISANTSEKPKYTVKEVMQAIHKGDENIGKRVLRGEGTREDLSKLVEYYQSLPLNQPARGELDSWRQKSSRALTTARDLQAGKPGGLEAYKQAMNCQACHNVHKPE